MALAFAVTSYLSIVFIIHIVGFSIFTNPIACLLSSSLVNTAFLLAWIGWIAPSVSSLSHLPTASQGPWYHRFLTEPRPEDLARFTNEINNDGIIRYFGVFNGERLLVTKPQSVKEMMQLQAYNFQKMSISKRIIGQITGDGLLVVNGDVHKRQRKSLNPAFKFKFIKGLFPKFWSFTSDLVESIEREINDSEGKPSGKKVVDVDSWLMRATLDIIASTGFGVNVDAIHNPNGELARLLPLSNSTSKRATTYRLLALLIPSTWLYLRLPMTRRYEIDEMTKAMRNAILPLIQSRRAAFVEKNQLHDLEDDSLEHKNNEGSSDDVISTLLKSKVPIPAEELYYQSASILAAGQDTTSVSTTWALYLLAHHPEIQQVLRDEIRSHLPSPSDRDQTVDASLLESLPYLAAVCNEALRLYPPAPYLRREVAKPGTTLLGNLIPVGTICVGSVWAMQRSPKTWGPDVLEFKPERFLQQGENGKLKFDPHAGFAGDNATYGLLAFGAGPRACIGERFARGEFAALLAGLVGKFEWSLVNPQLKMGEDVVLNFGIVTKPEGGLFLNARTVDGW